MLYVFYVDVGKRLVFDMQLVNESVLHLKHTVEESQNIPSNKQVLLISGGQCLEDNAKVCNYSAGTDTNPIYLFNKLFLEKLDMPSISSADYKSANNTDLNHLYEHIEEFNSKYVTFNSLNKVNDLAQKYLSEARCSRRYCDELNSDIFLQQQGWAAAIANLDDVWQNFQNQYEAFDAAYKCYLETRQENIELVDNFGKDLELLSKIPLMLALLEANEEERARIEACYDKTKLSNVTLLDWISTKDSEYSVEEVVQMCKHALEQYDENSLTSLRDDIANLFHPDQLKSLHNNTEIEEKLTVLSNLIVTIKGNFQDQEKKADSISLNHKRATALNDETILPDLLDTHKDTLKSMKANNTNLKSCRQLCVQSKKELCDIIHRQLKLVMLKQEQAAEIRSILVLHGGHMKRVRDYVNLLRQLHATPSNYLTAVAEVVRRRSYSQAFLMWASDLSCRISAIYTIETERRRNFMNKFEGHFLKCLFPGLEDTPPAFATQTPPLFDNNLPSLCEDDLIQLCNKVPNVEDYAELPDVSKIKDFFLTKLLTLSEANIQNDSEAQITSSVVDEMALVAKENGNFSQEMIVSTDDDHDRKVMNEQLLENERAEHEREIQSMKDGIAKVGIATQNTVISLKNDLTNLRDSVCSNQSDLADSLKTLCSQMEQYQYHIRILQQEITEKDDKIRSLSSTILQLESARAEDGEYEKIEKRVREEAQKEKERAIKEVTDQLNHDHKKEIELLRQRFKLMTHTNMERCTSDTSLEKIEGVIELANHEAIVDQLKFDFEMEKTIRINEEHETYERKLEQEKKKLEVEKQLLMNTIRSSISEDYNKQIDAMRVRESSLVSELQRHKETIHTLTIPEGGNYSIITRMEKLTKENHRLEAALIHERKLNYSYGSTSSQNNPISICSGEGDSAESLASLDSYSSSPDLQENRNSYQKIAYKKTNRASQQCKICFKSCNVGDLVLIVWDSQQKNFTILQDSSTLYFLHPNSLDSLGLKPPSGPSDESPRKHYCPAEVIEKEYCTMKKIANRYNVKVGERFYRVKVKPLLSVIRTS